MSVRGAYEQQRAKLIGNRLVKELAGDRFVLYYQSIVPVAANAPDSGFREILVRFKDEEQNLQAPGMFLHLLWEQGLMPRLDRWIVSRVARWIAGFEGTPAMRVAPQCGVNLSGDTMHRDLEFGSFILAVIGKLGVAARSFAFEVPVEEAFADSVSIARMMRPLRAAGCGFTLSGFTGDEASFAVATSLAFDFIKIDGSLLSGIARDAEARARLHVMNSRCQRLGARTVVMQVESAETLEILRDIRVDFAQGFGIELPRPLETAVPRRARLA